VLRGEAAVEAGQGLTPQHPRAEGVDSERSWKPIVAAASELPALADMKSGVGTRKRHSKLGTRSDPLKRDASYLISVVVAIVPFFVHHRYRLLLGKKPRE